MNCSPPGSSVHGMLQARILEWVAIPFSKRSFQPWDRTWVSCITGRFFTVWTIKRASNVYVREWMKKWSSTETLCKLHYLSDIWVLGVLMHSLLWSGSLQPPPHINIISLSYSLLYIFLVQWGINTRTLSISVCCCSVAQSCPALYDPMDCSMPGFSVLHHEFAQTHVHFMKFAQTHVHWVGDAISLSHPLLPPSPPALNLSQHQGLLQWIGSFIRCPKYKGIIAK